MQFKRDQEIQLKLFTGKGSSIYNGPSALIGEIENGLSVINRAHL